MKIIDFYKFGNVVTFYLGEYVDDLYWGDDWDDAPYEHNAGPVYEHYITGEKTIYFDKDDFVMEPCDGEYNSKWSKEDMKKGRVPCIVVVHKPSIDKYELEPNFTDWLGVDDPTIEKYYFEDVLLPGVSYQTNELHIEFDENGHRWEKPVDK